MGGGLPAENGLGWESDPVYMAPNSPVRHPQGTQIEPAQPVPPVPPVPAPVGITPVHVYQLALGALARIPEDWTAAQVLEMARDNKEFILPEIERHMVDLVSGKPGVSVPIHD